MSGFTCRLDGCAGVVYPGDTVDEFEEHLAAVHRGVVDDVRTPQQWERAAEHLIHQSARTGSPFLIADVLKPIGEHPTPGKRQYVNGQITARIAGDGWIRYATDHDSAKSPKSTSNSSLVRRWVGTEKATGKAAAA